MNHRILIAFILGILSACKPPAREEDPLPDLQAKGIYVVNEGNFQSGNGSVSFYNLTSGNVTRDLFSLKNNDQAGDVCQSLFFYQDHFYLVVNNSNKIEILDSNFVRTATVTGLTSPRYITFGSNGKGYITDLYGKEVSVLNTSSSSIEKKIPIKHSTEELLSYKDTIYVTSPGSKYLYLIGSNTNQLLDSIDVGFGSSSLVLDENAHLWVLTIGNKEMSIKPSLLSIDLIQRKIVLTYQFDANAYPTKLNFNPVNQYVYWIDKSINRFSTMNLSGNAEAVIASNNNSFYGLAIHPYNGNIIASDVGDYTQRSTVYLYNLDGVAISSFTADIISGFMLVK